MMEITSFTSEPQYQRPDERNDVVHYIPRPVVAQQPQPVAPVAHLVGHDRLHSMRI